MSAAVEQSAIHARQASRRLLIQALYQWQLNQCEYEELLHQYAEDEHWSRCDPQYFCQTLRGILGKYDALIELLQVCVDRPFAQIDPIERSILLLAGYELHFGKEAPVKVVITEAIRLAKKFGAQDGYRYVNAVLDRLAILASPEAET